MWGRRRHRDRSSGEGAVRRLLDGDAGQLIHDLGLGRGVDGADIDGGAIAIDVLDDRYGLDDLGDDGVVRVSQVGVLADFYLLVGGSRRSGGLADITRVVYVMQAAS